MQNKVMQNKVSATSHLARAAAARKGKATCDGLPNSRMRSELLQTELPTDPNGESRTSRYTVLPSPARKRINIFKCTFPRDLVKRFPLMYSKRKADHLR